MKRTLHRLLTVLALTAAATSAARAAVYVTIVQGLGGQDTYDRKFTEQREKLEQASTTLTDADKIAVFSGNEATRDNLLAHFTTLADRMTADDRAAIYLIGHGSYDGEQYKFNIPGPDITDKDLGEVLASLPGENHFLADTSSASGAILEALADDEHIVLTATRNGNEKNATEFGAYFVQALTSSDADANKNDIVSIQEAFDFAERGVANFFESQGKLATEHPQIRGDGTASFSLARLNVDAITDEDPRINTLLSRRQELDAEIETLQLNRDDYSNAEYLQKLQALVLESAEVGEQIDALRAGSEADAN